MNTNSPFPVIQKFTRCTYIEALEIQEQCLKELRGKDMALLGFEFPKTITLGKRSKENLDLKNPSIYYETNNIDVLHVDRGGEATLHNPGQLVIYPLVPLTQYHIRVRDFVCLIEKCTIEVLNKHFQIEAFTQPPEPGLFTKTGKITFLGLRIINGYSTHGLAINICNDLYDFQSIRSCGVQNQTLDKVSNYTSTSDLNSFFKLWCKEFLERIL